MTDIGGLGHALILAAPFAIVDVQMLVIKGLAVAGEGLVGYLGGGWGIRLLCRLVVHRRVPPKIVTMIQVLGMTTMGMLVYLWVFGVSQAGGLGGGGGWWPFGGKAGQGDNVGTSSRPTDPPVAPAQETLPQKPTETVSPEQGRSAQVRLLGGKRVVEQRFYQIDGETQALAWPDLRNRLEDLRQQKPPLKTIEILIFRDSVDRDNPAVTQLESWAKENGITPTISSPAREQGPDDDAKRSP